ncbi:hypothetical protein NIES593_06675 [Hydrococcus rivularis NIES-593]|uniref:Histidine kinase n=1 Tax=Hydrococcus rivularis NIES-593 TaxID=1921803 RepID=A0A1U7HMW2_9CYAN|nr:hypothetical protein [Hydrococcus rivularis]OKH24894.1 hypothetical protein NIES593_06675 [Hydrococcus rivularis NIES-593]
MDKAALQEKVDRVAKKREFLVQLLEKPNLGTLRLDVSQALEELDELLEEYKATFPQDTTN